MEIGDRLIVGNPKNIPIDIWPFISLKGAHKIIRSKKYKEYTLKRIDKYRYHLRAYSQYKNGFTPPIYDDIYFKNIEILDKEASGGY